MPTPMMQARSDLRLLLLQIRSEAQVGAEEHHSFARYAGLREDQIDILNVFETSDFAADSA